MRPLIPDGVNQKLDEIVTKLFEGNRIADRGMTVLNVKFAMNKSESILHPKLAHLYPALADKVSEHQTVRDNLTLYGLTPQDNSDYETPLAFFEKMLEYMLELEHLIFEAFDLSKEDDVSTYSFLISFMVEITKVTGQCLLLVDKAELYKDDWQSFDNRIEDFITL